MASVAECIAPGAPQWRLKWLHNAFWRFDSEALAMRVVPESQRGDFVLFAYEILPLAFVGGEERALEMPSLDVQPLDGYEPLGYDIVVLNRMDPGPGAGPGFDFGCSPLTCNSLMKDVAANEHCLLDSAQAARELARRVSGSDGRMGEPGDHAVVRVLRKKGKAP